MSKLSSALVLVVLVLGSVPTSAAQQVEITRFLRANFRGVDWKQTDVVVSSYGRPFEGRTKVYEVSLSTLGAPAIGGFQNTTTPCLEFDRAGCRLPQLDRQSFGGAVFNFHGKRFTYTGALKKTANENAALRLRLEALPTLTESEIIAELASAGAQYVPGQKSITESPSVQAILRLLKARTEEANFVGLVISSSGRRGLYLYWAMLVRAADGKKYQMICEPIHGEVTVFGPVPRKLQVRKKSR